MNDYFPLMITDAPAKTGTVPVTAPFDDAPIAEVETGGDAHVDKALDTAHKLFRNRDCWLPMHERIDILERAADIMSEESATLAIEAAREGGKPLMDSEIEAARAIDGVRLCVETLKTEVGAVIPMGAAQSSVNRVAFTQKEPIGVVVAVSAFNHPLNLIVHQVAAAVAAGCPVIVKPAGVTPLSCLRFVDILRRAGLPQEWCQAIITDASAVATRLVTDPRVGFFSFIGSAQIGWMLRSKLAPGTRCALEHGGVAPLIVAVDSDLELAVRAVTKGGYYHAGQVCVSVQRVYAHASIAREFAERLARAASDLSIGDPTLATTDIGPLIRHAEVERVHSWVEEALQAGTERLGGGEPISKSCYPCTVLFDPPSDVSVSRLEIFGPVVCVYPYDDMDLAIEQANGLSVAFQAAIFTSNLDTAFRAFRRLDASAVMVNEHTAFRVDGMPFAGLRESGLGVGGIPHTIDEMQIEKMLLIRSPEL